MCVILVLFCLIRSGLLLNIILDFELFIQDIRDDMVVVFVIYNIILITWKNGHKIGLQIWISDMHYTYLGYCPAPLT